MFTTDRDQVLLERLNRHPHLRARVDSLLAVVEDAAGDCQKADAAERRVIDELRQMGNEVLTAWAERGVEKQAVLAQAVVFQIWFLHQDPEFISIDKEANHNVMQFVEFGETNRLSC